MEKIVQKAFKYWLIGSVVLFFVTLGIWGKDDAVGCLAGEIVVGFNLLSLIWAWQRIYSGKGLALAVGVIVFKYAILGMSVYWLIVHQVVSTFGFLIGCAVLLFVMGFLSLEYRKGK